METAFNDRYKRPGLKTNQRRPRGDVCFKVNHKGQIPLRYLAADRFEAGRGPVADLLARASSLLAS